MQFKLFIRSIQVKLRFTYIVLVGSNKYFSKQIKIQILSSSAQSTLDNHAHWYTGQITAPRRYFHVWQLKTSLQFDWHICIKGKCEFFPPLLHTFVVPRQGKYYLKIKNCNIAPNMTSWWHCRKFFLLPTTNAAKN